MKTAGIITAIAFGYFSVLSAKEWTWIFVSFDSGDWLASSLIWMVPQPYGSPLYITLGHLLNLLPGDLVILMTIGLSVIPGAITVGLVYLIIKQLGYSQKLAILGSATLLGCGIFLSQATVLEEYAITAMLVTLAFYFHIKENKKLTLLFLGLASAIHIIAVAISALWVLVHYKEIRKWLLPIATIYTPIVAVSYGLILYLMWADTPKLIAGNLSLQSINAYLGSTSTIGRISLVETPGRLYEASTILLLGFGINLIPLWYGLRKPWNTMSKLMITLFVFSVWIYVTNVDMTTWTFMTFCIPIAVVTIVIGLSKLPKWSHYASIICVGMLILVNSFSLNANLLTVEKSEATHYYKAIEELPNSSFVVLPKGGAYGLGLIYAYAEGRDLVPVFMQKEEGWTNQGYLDYIDWISNHKGLEGSNWIEQVNYCLETDKTVFIAYDVQPQEWKDEISSRYETEYFNEYFREITSKS